MANLIDTIMGVLTLFLLALLALTFIAGGIGFAMIPNPRFGPVGNAIAADLMMTLGLTTLVGLLVGAFPRSRLCRNLADQMFRKLCTFAVVFAIVLLVVLLLLI